ncbi:hypothetical protein [Nocardia mexicana]|uniref:Uncharacterized protein n=1 Tax=Nocardia mexicana TaxID=279262 RepID=A0A370GYZ0_9NOCA|nr:hypothetical protein [Nocardia mexicana]RDI48500.1 hypothetical protein DFR68_108333 [Nocardia mexicana]
MTSLPELLGQVPPAVAHGVVATLSWAGAEVGAGWAAATTLQRVLTSGGPVLVAVAVVLVAAGLVWAKLHGRPDSAGSGGGEEGSGGGGDVGFEPGG